VLLLHRLAPLGGAHWCSRRQPGGGKFYLILSCLQRKVFAAESFEDKINDCHLQGGGGGEEAQTTCKYAQGPWPAPSQAAFLSDKNN
jgi:hypothetical protein